MSWVRRNVWVHLKVFVIDFDVKPIDVKQLRRSVWVHLKVFVIDFDVKPIDVKQLRKVRWTNAFWAVNNFVLTVCIASGPGWWAIPLAIALTPQTISRTMRALSAHKQIPEQVVREVMRT